MGTGQELQGRTDLKGQKHRFSQIFLQKIHFLGPRSSKRFQRVFHQQGNLGIEQPMAMASNGSFPQPRALTM